MNPKIHQAMVNYDQTPSPKFISNVNKDYYYMAVLAIRSVRKMTHADWLPSRAISFLYRPASFGGKISELIWRKTIKIPVRFTEDL